MFYEQVRNDDLTSIYGQIGPANSLWNVEKQKYQFTLYLEMAAVVLGVFLLGLIFKSL